MRKLTGRGFLFFLVASLCIGGNLFAADKPVTLIVENVYPPSHARLGQKAVIGKWFDAVEKDSNGMIKLDRHWAGEPVPSKEALDALAVGTLDMVIAFPPFFSGKVAIADVAAMPKNFRTFADIYDL